MFGYLYFTFTNELYYGTLRESEVFRRSYLWDAFTPFPDGVLSMSVYVNFGHLLSFIQYVRNFKLYYSNQICPYESIELSIYIKRIVYKS